MSSPIYTRTTIPLQDGITCEILETNPQGIVDNGISLETIITQDVELNGLIDSAAAFINRKYGEKYTDLGKNYKDGFLSKDDKPFKRTIASHGYDKSFAQEIFNLRETSHMRCILFVVKNAEQAVIGTCVIKANCNVGVYNREYIPKLIKKGITGVNGDNCVSIHSVSAEKGFGQTVMIESLKYAFTKDFRFVIIEVYYRGEDRKLIEFYRKLGFSEITDSEKKLTIAPDSEWKQIAMYKEITQHGGKKYRKSRTYRKSRNYKK